MDEQVPKPITIGLRQRGVDVLTVQEDGRSSYPDPLLVDRATELRRVIFSQDEDLPLEAYRRQGEGIIFSGVIYARQSQVSIEDCVRDLELIAKVSEPDDCANCVQYLPLSN
jgi:predicted nuclease of predicted toxin-antitoxin system